MKKHKIKIISGIVILIILTIASLGGGNKDITSENAESYDAPTETKVQIKEEKPIEADVPEVNKDIELQSDVKDTAEECETASVDDSELEETADSNKKHTCILSVKCDTILNNISLLKSEKVDIIPQNGVIFAEKEVIFHEGESVFNVLVREMKRNKIHLEFEMSPLYETAYIKGIANIYEFDCGELSGWLYRVNNENPTVGCSLYKLKNGDVVEWIYTCG